MAFKRYIKIKGKNYGPYYYKSYRENGKVINKYISKEIEPASDVNSAYKPQKYGILAFLVLALFCIGLIWLLGNLKSVGHAGLNIETEYVPGENLIGSINFNLKEGELIPANSMLILELGNNSIEVPISEVLDNSKVSGDFFAEGVSLSGSGEGYGIAGSKIIYPKVDFELLVSADSGSVNEEQPIEQPETPEEEITDGRIAQEETTTDNGGEAINDDGIAQEETPTDNEESAGGEISGGGMTGMAICGDEFIVAGSASKGEDYVHTLEDGQSAEIASGSVKVDGQEIGDCEINLDVSGNEARVSTEYEISEKGFGEDYLGEEMLSLSVDISELNLKAEEGEFNVRLVYDNSVIAEVSEDISVLGTEIPASNLSLIKDIPAIRIQKNGNFSLDLSEYFAGAERYALEVSDIGAEFDGEIIVLIPNEDFKGSRKGKIIAYAGASSLESNEFNILVSSGAVNIDISRGDIKVGERVRWVQNVSLELPEDITIELPKEAQDVKVKKVENEITENVDAQLSGITGSVIYGEPVKDSGESKGWFSSLFEKKTSGSRRVGITGLAVDGEENNLTEEGGIEVLLDENATEYSIEYYTEAPHAFEQETEFGKRVIISAPSELNYTDVLSFANISEILDVGQESKIRIHWVENDSYVGFDAYDMDSNGKLDYIEWITPHLSNQTFDIILIIAAQHLDENRTFISDIFDYVNEQDDNWSEPIYSNQYVRATFEQNLTNGNIINIYARNTQGLNSSIEVYEKDGSTLLASTPIIIPEQMYDVQLAGMNGSSDAFDIKIVNEERNSNAYLEFDYIQDAGSLASFSGSFFEGFESASLATNNWTNTGANSWAISTTRYAGSYGIEGKNVPSGATLETGINTASYSSIKFSFWAETVALTSGEYISADWYNGTGWVVALPQTQTIAAFTYYNYSLSSAASNNPNFKIRFKCLNSGNSHRCYIDNVNVSGTYSADTSPPKAVTNLNNVSSGDSWILWNWTNPTDSDFGAAIIYVNGTNVANVSVNNYTANGLISNTNYTIRINTKDATGNVNYTNVTNTAKTTLNLPPSVTLNAPNGETYEPNSIVIISTSIYDANGVNYSLAQVTLPNSSVVNETLRYNNQIPNDNFNTNSIGTNWFFENVNINSSTQTCVANINSAVAGKAHMSITGKGGAMMDTWCSLVAMKPIDGDFDINVTFNMPGETLDDIAFNFGIGNKRSSYNSTRQIFFALSDWTGQQRGYEIYADDGTYSGYILTKPSADTYGKMRIKRTGNSFTFYTWTGSDWNQETVSQNTFDLPRDLYVYFDIENAAGKWGNVNVSLDDFAIWSNNYSIALFNRTSLNGVHNFRIISQDSLGLTSNTTNSTFVIGAVNNLPTTPWVSNPSANDIINGTYVIEWSSVTDLNGDALAYNITLRNVDDNSFNATIVSGYGSASTINYAWNTSLFANGNYDLRVLVYETSTAEHYTNSYDVENISISNADSTKPLIQFVSPSETSGSLLKRNNIAVNATASDVYLANIAINLYNSTGLINSTTSLTSPLFLNFTNLVNGIYYFNATALDLSGNSNSTETRNVTINVDTTAPAVFDLRPIENSSYISLDVVEIAANVSDVSGISSVWANLILPNETIEQRTLSLAVGNKYNASYVIPDFLYNQFNITFFANDSVGNLNNTEKTYFRDDPPGTWLDSGLVCYPNPVNNGTNIICNITYTCTSQNCVRGPSGFYLQDDGIRINDKVCSTKDFICNNVTILASSTCANRVANGVTCRAGTNSAGCSVGQTLIAQYNFTACSGLEAPPSTNIINASFEDDGGSTDSATLDDSFVENITMPDNVPPLVTLNSPLNQTYNTTTINFNVSINENGTCKFSLDLAANISMSTTDNRNFNYVNSTMTQGSHNARYYCNDSAGNLNNTKSVVFGVDTIIPMIQFESLTETSGSILGRSNININVTASDSGGSLKNITIYLYNSTGLVNSTTTLTSPNFVNISNLANGIYYFNATAYDSAGNRNLTETRNVTIDTSAPLISIIRPQNLTYNNATQLVNISASDSIGISRIWFYNGTGNETYTTAVYRTFAEGSNTLYAWANDTSGNLNYTSVVFNIDTTAPSISIVSPASANYTNATILVNISISGANYTWFFNGTGNETYSGAVYRTFNQGSITVYAYANDSVGNLNYSSVMFFVDSIKPLIDFVSPTPINNSILSQNNIPVNISVNDTNLDKVVLRLYNSSALINTTISSSSNLFINFANLANGIYYINATANDTLGNENSTSTRKITLDTIKPSVAIVYPQNTSYGNSVEQLNYSVSDVNLQACWYSTDFGANNNSVTCGQNETGLTSAEGSNTWIAWANDSAGNVNYSSVTFIVDLSAPGIYFVTPTENNEDYLNRKNIQVNITASNLQVANVTIRLYNATGFVNSSMTNETALEIHLYVNFSNLNDGVYYFNATAVDAFSRSNSTGTRNVTIDTIKPLISLVSPTDNSGISVNRNNIAINASANDSNLQSITISIYNSTSGLVYSYNSGNSSLFVNQSGLDDGFYYFNATALDLAGNSNSTETRNITIETQAPLITINSPQNITYTTQIILFNVTLSENGTCLYSLDSSANRTMSSSNNRAYSAVNSTMTEGSHNVMFNCNDSVGNFNSTSVVFFVDSIYPLINYGDGTETSGTIMIRTNIVVNASASDGNFANLTINLHNSTGLVNSTTTLTTSLFLNFTNLVDGIYYFNATALDLAGNSNSTETRNVTIDTRAPVVVDLIPAANASFNPLETIEIGANVSNAHNIDSVFANVTLANGTTSLITLSNVFGVKYNNSFAIPGLEGRYNITIIANDSLGNLNDSETTYFVVRDSIVPSIYLFNPGSGVNYVSTSQNVVFQYNVSDFNIANCSLVVNNAVSNTSLSVNTSAGAINQFTNVFGAGSYSWNIRCADNNNNINSSAARSFSVTAPVVTPPSEGGGGGGGGGGAPTYPAPTPKEEAGKPVPISVNPEELSIMLVAGTGAEREITIRNLRNTTISLAIISEGEIARIVNAPTGLSLAPNEEKVVKLTISKAEKGLLTGKIVIRTGDYSKDVPVVINLKSENFLFDSALTIPEEYRAIKPGDDLVAQVNLLQVGPKEKVDVVATYVIKDLTGKKYLEETETFFVLEAKDYVKTFYTDNFPAGKYVLGLDIAYPGAFATSSAQFEILGTGIDKFSNQTIILILVLGVIGLGFLVWVLRARSLLYKGLVKRGINRKV